MHADDLRRWVAERRDAAARERRELREAGADPAHAIQSALALIALADRFAAPSAVADEREAAQVRDRWARLRRFYGRP